MLDFLTRRHQRLMDESEQGLLEASQSRCGRESRISGLILTDQKLHRLWESQHAHLLVKVARQRKTARQILGLRRLGAHLIHGRAFIEYVRDREIVGEERRCLFKRYYSLTDYRSAILAAHRQYLLSVSSTVSTKFLIDLMFDPVSHRLLEHYHEAYGQYFELTSYSTGCEDASCVRALKPIISTAKIKLDMLRQKLVTEAPHIRCTEFERQARLAKSGRFPALNYLAAS